MQMVSLFLFWSFCLNNYCVNHFTQNNPSICSSCVRYFKAAKCFMRPRHPLVLLFTTFLLGKISRNQTINRDTMLYKMIFFFIYEGCTYGKWLLSYKEELLLWVPVILGQTGIYETPGIHQYSLHASLAWKHSAEEICIYIHIWTSRTSDIKKIRNLEE